jgi:hypothetical protein
MLSTVFIGVMANSVEGEVRQEGLLVTIEIDLPIVTEDEIMTTTIDIVVILDLLQGRLIDLIRILETDLEVHITDVLLVHITTNTITMERGVRVRMGMYSVIVFFSLLPSQLRSLYRFCLLFLPLYLVYTLSFVYMWGCAVFWTCSGVIILAEQRNS